MPGKTPKGGATTTDAGSEEKPRNRLLKATCACEPPYIIRASRKVLTDATIRCESCGATFGDA